MRVPILNEHFSSSREYEHMELKWVSSGRTARCMLSWLALRPGASRAYIQALLVTIDIGALSLALAVSTWGYNRTPAEGGISADRDCCCMSQSKEGISS